MSATRATRCATAIAAVLTLAACSPTQPAPSELPDGIEVGVYQTREDIGNRQLEIRVRNGSDEPLDITSMRFSAPQFVEPADWAKDSTRITPGVAADLPIALPEADCADGGFEASVDLGFTLADGSTGTATIAAEDEFARLPDLKKVDCFIQAVDQRLDIAPGAALRRSSAGPVQVAQLDIALTPTGAPGSVTIDQATSTVLLALSDPSTGLFLNSGAIGVTMDAATPPTSLTLTFTPARCDVHVIAEDKRGTYLPLEVSLEDGTSGTYYVKVDDAVKVAFYTFVAEACGLE